MDLISLYLNLKNQNLENHETPLQTPRQNTRRHYLGYKEIGGDMKLEDQVCSLELAKRIKELGVKQESQFYWFKNNIEGYPLKGRGDLIGYYPEAIKERFTSAFTCSELGEMLSLTIGLEHRARLTCRKGMTEWLVGYGKVREDFQIDVGAKTLADALAKMLIYLIEQGLVKP